MPVPPSQTVQIALQGLLGAVLVLPLVAAYPTRKECSIGAFLPGVSSLGARSR